MAQLPGRLRSIAPLMHGRERIPFHRARSAGLPQGKLLRIVGAALGGLGAGLAYCGWRMSCAGDPKRARRRRKATSAAMTDFDWDPRGIDSRPWRGVPLSLIGLAVLTPVLFLALPVSGEGGLDEHMGEILVLGTCLMALGIQGYRFVRALKHGTCHLAFERFPFASGERLALRFSCPGDLTAFDRFELTLRYVQEAWEERDRHGRDPSHVEVVSYALWSETQGVDRDKLMHARGGELPVAFDLPESAPPTRLAMAPPSYWELSVRGVRTGVDLRADFPLPVHGGRAEVGSDSRQ